MSLDTPGQTAGGFRTTSVPSGEAVPVLGMGTWYMAERTSQRETRFSTAHSSSAAGDALILP
jgi:hypothetical protein